jgi:predicted naringenin-chalcone synthase
MSFITSVGVAVPSHKIEQPVISNFMQSLAESEEERRKIATVFRASGIKTRYSVLADYGKSNNFDFFPNTVGMNPFPGTASRMAAFREYATSLSIAAIEDCRKHNSFDYESITHLVTVSCTGMYAPGLDIDLVNQLSLNSSVNRTCINFMGCFAAISAIKMADAYCLADHNAKVLIVCTELCSLHFQKDFTDDNILANALFADGAAALLVQSKPGNSISLSIDGFYSDIASNGAEHMAWSIGNLGFEMKLSTYVPEVLAQGIGALVDKLVKKVDIDASQITHYAIHPGGKKILDSASDKLGISHDKLQASYDVLHDYGNMSSPTVLFVLKKMLQANHIQKNDRILGLAFGPGITMESVLLKIDN